MAGLLLDAHISPAVAPELQRHGMEALAVRDWRGGNLASAPDDQILLAALEEGRVLVTFDLRTIPSLLKEWAETGQDHAGVILVDERSIRQDDIGGLVRALRTLLAENAGTEWKNRAVFLQAEHA